MELDYIIFSPDLSSATFAGERSGLGQSSGKNYAPQEIGNFKFQRLSAKPPLKDVTKKRM